MASPDPYTYNAANAVTNPPIDLVRDTAESIAEERGISRRWAYALIRDAREAAETAAPPPNNQRERVLLLLYRAEGSIRNTNELLAALHADGYSIDGHDVTKTMWSLQKTGHVKFRERQKPRFLYALQLTDLGHAEGKAISERKAPPVEPVEEYLAHLDEEIAEVETNVGPDQQDAAHEIAQEHAQKVAAAAGEQQEEVVSPIEAHVSIYAFISEGFPTITALRERYAKSQRLAQASAILEDVGEDEMALALMNKIEFTPLEREIIKVLEDLDKKEAQ